LDQIVNLVLHESTNVLRTQLLSARPYLTNRFKVQFYFRICTEVKHRRRRPE